jgi:hypothetical protein
MCYSIGGESCKLLSYVIAHVESVLVAVAVASGSVAKYCGNVIE